MSVDDLLGEFNYQDVKEEWRQTPKEKKKIPESKWEDDSDDSSKLNLNIAIRALEWKGKSCVATTFGFINTKYFDKLQIKDLYPKCYDMIKTGFLPEVELTKVLDLDGSFKTQSKAGIFGRLVKPLYDAKSIKRCTIKIPKPKINYIDDQASQVAKAVIAGTKLRIDQEISDTVVDSGHEVLFIIDSMSSYDELLNDLFNIVYEDYLAKPKRGEEKDFNKEFSYMKGINQKYYKIRNGWWIDTLRNKRTFPGFQIDTIKMEIKHELWFEKELKKAKDEGKDPEKIDPYITVWVPRTKFDLDMVLTLDNKQAVNEKGVKYFTEFWADTMIRMNSNQHSADVQETFDRIDIKPNRRTAAYDILEGLAPYLLGEVEDDEGNLLNDDDLWC